MLGLLQVCFPSYARVFCLIPSFCFPVKLFLYVLERFFQGVSLQGGLNGQLSFDDDFLLLAIVLNVAVTLVVVILCWTVANIGITIDIEECLVSLLIHTIFHILLIGKGIAVDAVIEADGWRIGIYRREDKAVLTFYICPITALRQYIAFSRYIASRSAIGIGKVDVMILLTFKIHWLFINADNHSPKEVVACLVVLSCIQVE